MCCYCIISSCSRAGGPCCVMSLRAWLVSALNTYLFVCALDSCDSRCSTSSLCWRVQAVYASTWVHTVCALDSCDSRCSTSSLCWRVQAVYASTWVHTVRWIHMRVGKRAIHYHVILEDADSPDVCGLLIIVTTGYFRALRAHKRCRSYYSH